MKWKFGPRALTVIAEGEGLPGYSALKRALISPTVPPDGTRSLVSALLGRPGFFMINSVVGSMFAACRRCTGAAWGWCEQM